MKDKKAPSLGLDILIFISAGISVITLIRNLIYGYPVGMSLLAAGCWIICAAVRYRRHLEKKEDAEE